MGILFVTNSYIRGQRVNCCSACAVIVKCGNGAAAAAAVVIKSAAAYAQAVVSAAIAQLNYRLCNTEGFLMLSYYQCIRRIKLLYKSDYWALQGK